MKEILREKIEKMLRQRWVKNWELSQLAPSALRRVRDLRQSGFNVIKHRDIKKGKVSNTWSYKIV
jgi:hypothetical protein